MSRMSFADLVRGTGINVVEEYKELLNLLTGRAYQIFPGSEFQGNMMEPCEERSFSDICDESFESLPIDIRGTCRTIAGFNAYHEYAPARVTNPNLDDLLLFAEYFLTFSYALGCLYKNPGFYIEGKINKRVLSHLMILKDRLHHTVVFDGDIIKLVPQDVIVSEVASNLPKEVSIKTFLYRHRSMAGKLEEKRHVLKLLGDQLEPIRADIQGSELRSAIFSLLNNMNIRHNNMKPGDAHYHAFVSGLSDKEREVWYDRLYDMMLAAFSGLNARNALGEYMRHKDVIGA